MSKPHLLYLFLLSGILLLPAFLWGAGGVDLHCITLWVRLFSEQFWAGELYPRWLMDMFAGAGSPIFFYYPPLAYHAAALFAFLAPMDPFGYYPVAAASLLAVLISGVTFYRWARQEADESAALLGSLLYMATPFHVAHSFYYTLLFPTVWSYAWAPLLLLYAKKIARRERFAIAGFAVALFLMVVTNIPSTIILGPTAVAYGMFTAGKPRLFAALRDFAAAILLGFGLSGIYLLPAMLYQDYASVDIHWYSDYSTRFVIPGFANTGQGLFFASFLLALALTLLLYFAAAKTYRKERLFFLAASLAALFMITPLSHPLWELFPVLKMLQQPARFFIVPSIGTAMLALLALPRHRKMLQGLLLVFIAATFVIAWESKISYKEFMADATVAERYNFNVDQYPTYLTSPDLINRYFTPAGLAEAKKHIAQIELLKGTAQLKVIQWRPRAIRIGYSASTATVLRIRQFYFPGMTAAFEGQGYEVGRDEETGYATLSLPAGDGEVSLTLSPLLPESIGKMLSIVSALALAFLLLYEVRRMKNPRVAAT